LELGIFDQSLISMARWLDKHRVHILEVGSDAPLAVEGLGAFLISLAQGRENSIDACMADKRGVPSAIKLVIKWSTRGPLACQPCRHRCYSPALSKGYEKAPRPSTARGHPTRLRVVHTVLIQHRAIEIRDWSKMPSSISKSAAIPWEGDGSGSGDIIHPGGRQHRNKGEEGGRVQMAQGGNPGVDRRFPG